MADAVKHVAPYPIPVRIVKAEGQPPIVGSIVKITEIGFLMKIDGIHLFTVSDIFPISFELPAVHKMIHTDVRVIKTYDGYEISGQGKVKMNTIEMHFKHLNPEHRTLLENYLVQSGQKKR